MKTLHDIIRDRLLKDVVPSKQKVRKSIEELRKTEWSPRFEELMRNRLLMGSFRYEPFSEKAKSMEYDCATEAIARVQRFIDTGNTEHLVDAANMCLLEFEFSNHPNKHFASIDDGEHTEKIRS